MNGVNRHGNVHCLVLFKPKSTANISYGSNTLKQEMQNFYINTKRIRNEIRKITRQIHIDEQFEVANAAKSNPKKLWAYIRNKTSLKTTVGDIKTNISDTEIVILDDADKESAFCQYFSSVFAIDTDVSTVEDCDSLHINASSSNVVSDLKFDCTSS